MTFYPYYNRNGSLSPSVGMVVKLDRWKDCYYKVLRLTVVNKAVIAGALD